MIFDPVGQAQSGRFDDLLKRVETGGQKEMEMMMVVMVITVVVMTTMMMIGGDINHLDTMVMRL